MARKRLMFQICSAVGTETRSSEKRHTRTGRLKMIGNSGYGDVSSRLREREREKQSWREKCGLNDPTVVNQSNVQRLITPLLKSRSM